MRRIYLQWAEATLLRYVLMVGVVLWGTLSAALFALFGFFGGGSYALVLLPLLFVMFWIGGVFWGLGMWYVVVRKRKNAVERAGKTDMRGA